MKKKRIRHAADILCKMFCGWRLANSYRALVELGSGNLEVDALTETCKFNGVLVPRLSIAGELGGWLREDLSRHGIDLAFVRGASLKVDLSLSRVPSKPRDAAAMHLDRHGKPMNHGDFYRLAVRCSSSVSFENSTFTASHEDVHGWPCEWPDA